jgi:hypothetical protein
MLDTVRAVRRLMPDEFGESRFAMTGYSGGAIASYAAAMLSREYAPELAPNLAGAAMGGLPVDYESFAKTFDGTYASGLMMTVTLALAREHPEILSRMNHLAQWAAISPLKDVCSSTMADIGVFVPFAAVANMADPLHTEFADMMFRRLSLKGKKAGMPSMSTTACTIPGCRSRRPRRSMPNSVLWESRPRRASWAGNTSSATSTAFSDRRSGWVSGCRVSRRRTPAKWRRARMAQHRRAPRTVRPATSPGPRNPPQRPYGESRVEPIHVGTADIRP